MESVTVLDFVQNVLGLRLNVCPGYTTLKHLSAVCMLNHNKTINFASCTPYFYDRQLSDTRHVETHESIGKMMAEMWGNSTLYNI